LIKAHRFRLNSLSLLTSGRRLRKGDVIEQAPGYDRGHPPGLFTDIGEGERYLRPGIPEGAGIGDNIYAIPSLYHGPGEAPQTTLFVPKRSLPVFRCVRDSVQVGSGEADFMNALDSTSDKELTDQIATILNVEPMMKLPVMETTVAEKRAVLKMQESRGRRPYVCVAPWSSDPVRSMQKLKCWAERYLPQLGYDYEWYWSASADDRLKTYMQLVDGAEFVISVGTSAIPMAGALQKPVISLVPHRSGHFLDDWQTDMEHLTQTVENLIDKIDWQRCWCGASTGKQSVVANTYVIKCPACGTIRQEVSVSERGLARFYELYYDPWRQIVEGEHSYSDAAKIKQDTDTAYKRIAQWGYKKGERWLDVGCGNKCLVFSLAAFGIQAECTVDDSRPGGKFDTISYVDVLEHIRDPLKELTGMRKRLSEGGRIIVALPMVWEAGGEPKHIRRLQHIWLWTEETFAALALNAGLKIKKTIRPVKGRAAFILQKE